MKLILLCFSGAASVEKGYMNILSLPRGSSRQLCCSHGTSRSPLFWNSTGLTFLFSCSSQKLNFSWTAPDCADFPIEYGRFCPNRLTVSQLSIAIHSYIHSYPWGFPSPSQLCSSSLRSQIRVSCPWWFGATQLQLERIKNNSCRSPFLNWVCLKMVSTPLYPMVNDHYPY